MTDETHSEADNPESERSEQEPSGTEEKHESVIALSNGLQAAARHIGEQMTEFHRRSMEALNSLQLQLTAPLTSGLLQTNWPSPLLDNLSEQIRQASRITVPTPQYDFGTNLGRILEAHSKTLFEGLRTFTERLKQLIPENLLELPTTDLREVFRVNAEDGTSLAWAPRTSIVAELIQATDMPARDDILTRLTSEIADDIEASLDVITRPEHQDLRFMMLEAVAALRAGLHRPAQAAACAAFDTVVNVHMLNFLAYTGQRSKDRTRKHFRPVDIEDWEELSLAELELVLVGAGISTAFQYWQAGNGPASFNRNGTIHHTDDGAYSPGHAVRALLIAQATLRWLDVAMSAEEEDEDTA
ncbi:hypothetical protein [Streptomyces dubilierae]|uniref:Uncharacterized protein n=1 Tax=Streptomyces dubilierae TaxID=3075533 RepID=A0ABU2P874_9ACTN|nr:hypothetical protein [Streptomyces sp. DSM 41921]MDT0387844.1 hypothetical protein [Streptomyces sp. DSM 41921]